MLKADKLEQEGREAPRRNRWSRPSFRDCELEPEYLIALDSWGMLGIERFWEKFFPQAEPRFQGFGVSDLKRVVGGRRATTNELNVVEVELENWGRTYLLPHWETLGNIRAEEQFQYIRLNILKNLSLLARYSKESVKLTIAEYNDIVDLLATVEVGDE